MSRCFQCIEDTLHIGLAIEVGIFNRSGHASTRSQVHHDIGIGNCQCQSLAIKNVTHDKLDTV